MNTAYIPVSFKKSDRIPLVQKIQSDAEIMMVKSKYVIVLDCLGKVVSCPTPFDDYPKGKLDCLVVVAPLTYRRVHISYAIVLEIGFNRFVPYAQTEYRVKERGGSIKTKAVKERQTVANLSSDALMKIAPYLFDVIKTEVTERIKGWKRASYIRVGGHKKYPHRYEVPALAYVRIPKNAELLHYGAMLHDLKWRTKNGGNLWARACQIREWLTQFMKLRSNHKTSSGDYVEKTVKQSKSLALLADKLRVFQLRHEKSPHYVKLLDQMVNPSPSSAVRKLLRQVRVLHKVPLPRRNYHLERLEQEYSSLRKQLENGWRLHTVIDAKRNRTRLVHAKECLVIGVASEEALRRERMTQNYKVDEQDADIPF